MASKFVFNLEALKKLRSHRLGIAKKEYMRIQNALFRVEDEIKSLKLQRRQSLGEIGDNLSDGLRVNGMSFLITAISDKIKILEEKIKELSPEVERYRRWMVEASRELRSIELLEEKRRDEFNHQQELKEKRRADQWASENHARKMALDDEERRTSE
jgi:flagellar export protein FliJ